MCQGSDYHCNLVWTYDLMGVGGCAEKVVYRCAI